MLNKKDALDISLEIYNTYRVPEQRRLNRIDTALQPKVGEDGLPVSRIELPEDAPEILHQLTVESETNYLPLLLDTYAQVMRVDGYITENEEGARDPWETWQRNRLDSRQTTLHRTTLAYGTGYALAFPGTTPDGEEYAATRLYSPRNMTAVYSEDGWEDWPAWALLVTDQHWELIGAEETHVFGLETRPRPGEMGHYTGNRYLHYIEPREHDLGVTPVVRYQDRHYLADEKVLGIVEPLLTVQRRLDRTSANQMIAQQIAIFRQKYVVGWVPENEEEELKASLAKVHYVDMDPSEVQFGEWDATEIEPYLAAGNQARRDFSALGQIPAQSLGLDGISNISDATLAGLEAAKNRRAGIITTSLGESHEQLLRLFAAIDGNTVAAHDYSSEVLWRDFESRSFGATVDGLQKLVAMGLPPEIAMEDVPGMTGQKLARVQKAMRRAEGSKLLQDLRAAAQSPTASAVPVEEPGESTPPAGSDESTPPAGPDDQGVVGGA